MIIEQLRELSRRDLHLTRRRGLLLLGSLLLNAACNKPPDVSTTPTLVSPRLIPTTIISEQERQRLDQERSKLITRQAQKPADTIPFPDTFEAIAIQGTNILVSVNGIPSGLEIFYSPSGIRQLSQDLNLSRTPALQLHLLTGDILEATADTQWEERNCKFFAPIQYMNALATYVLSRFPEKDWDAKSSEITQEWNNRMNAIVRHESKHAASHFQINNCKLVSSTPKLQAEIEAMQEEIQSRGNPLVFWFNLKQGEFFSKNPLVQYYWRQRK